MVSRWVVYFLAATANTFNADLRGYFRCENLYVFFFLACNCIPLLDEPLMLVQVFVVKLLACRFTDPKVGLAYK